MIFITFEGVDGSGKTSQIELLKDFFESKGYVVTVFKETTIVNSAILEFQLISFALARFVTLNRIFDKTIFDPDSNRVVILDRFIDSTHVYQLERLKIRGRTDIVDYYLECEKMFLDQIKRFTSFRLTFFLDVPLSKCKSNLKNRKEKLSDFEQSYNNLNDIIQRYKKHFDNTHTPKDYRIVSKIKADKDVLNVHNEILDNLKFYQKSGHKILDNLFKVSSK